MATCVRDENFPAELLVSRKEVTFWRREEKKETTSACFADRWLRASTPQAAEKHKNFATVATFKKQEERFAEGISEFRSRATCVRDENFPAELLVSRKEVTFRRREEKKGNNFCVFC
ncbi:hypothetical protein CEXT_196231 [Caerostris extrusa]|uniref:Uncharacterized protein n=1 Tax=Caerostris extrusa TaxID=172846 RepID=A0AAV4VKV6_CAEEX|nr:hypothetical protein CEXT_196231 [Caerostris extrusa]